MKRKIALLTCISIFASSIAFAADLNKFKDIDQNAWYRDAVEYVLDENLFNGMSEDTFAPDADMTRGMFVTVLGRKSKDDMSKYENSSSFKDISTDAYYSKYAEWAKDNNIMIGVGDDNFAPDEEISRQDVVKALHNYYSAKYDLDSEDIKIDNDLFLDINDLAEYVKPALNWALEFNIIRGYEDKINALYNLLKPEQNITRAEIAQIFKRLENYEKFLIVKKVISFDIDDIESLGIIYDPGYPDSAEKSYIVDKKEKIVDFLKKLNIELESKEIEEIKQMSPSEITANYRVNLKITTKDGGEYNLYFYGDSEEENGLIIKGNNFYYFKEPLNLEF